MNLFEVADLLNAQRLLKALRERPLFKAVQRFRGIKR